MNGSFHTFMTYRPTLGHSSIKQVQFNHKQIIKTSISPFFGAIDQNLILEAAIMN